MRASSDRWQQLNAYVDGELDPQARAEIAAAIAQDRELAAAAATLSRLKATTGAIASDIPPVDIHPPQPSHRRRAVAAVAATVAAAAVAAIYLAATPSLSPNLDAAIRQHAAWVAADPPAAEPVAAPLLVALARLDRPVELPDLRDSGLEIVRIATLEEPGAAGLHVSYLGSRGCRVSLVVTKAEAAAASLRQTMEGMEIARWTAGDLAYALLASGMPRERFMLIAASAEEAVRNNRPVPPPVREALRRERDTSTPCAG